MGFYKALRSARWMVANYPADRYARLLKKSQFWSREKLQEYRDEKLRRLIIHCYDNVPYYRNLMDEHHLKPEDIRGTRDLAKFPILTKDIIRKFSTRLVAKTAGSMSATWTRTGGTTGERVQIYKSKDCKAWSSMCYERGLSWGGKTVEEPTIHLFGGTLGIDGTSFNSRIGNFFRGDVFIPAYELRHANALSYLQKIKTSKCRFIIGYASAIYTLATLANDLGQEVELSAAFPTAEILLPEWEAMIRNTFKCLVLPYYGCGEVNSLGFSAQEGNGYFIPEEHAFIESSPSDGSTQLYGNGKFLVTDLDNYAMPIIRYLNGDFGAISPSEGQFPFSRIERLDGRSNSLLMTEGGELISGIVAVSIFRFTSSVKRYRVIQKEPLTVVVKVVPKTYLDDKDEVLITSLFKKYLGNGMRVVIEQESDLASPPSGKSVFVVNECLH